MILRNLFAELQWRHRHREQTSGHGREGTNEQVGLIESSMEKHPLPYVK